MAAKRRIYLINPSFQIKFSILIVAIVLLTSSIIYPYLIFDILTNPQAENIIQKKVIESHQSQEIKTKVIIFLCILQFLFGSIVFCFSIIFSHKIAGPIYKLQKYLSAIRNGNGMGTLKFRNGDYFQELAEDYNTTLEKIQENYRNDFVYLNEVSSYLNQITHSVPEDKRQNIEKINERLMEIQNRFNNLY